MMYIIPVIHICHYIATCYYYAIRVFTGSDPLSGTRNDLSVELVGSLGRTGSVTQRNVRFIVSKVANTSCYDDIVLECRAELGDVFVIVLGNIEGKKTTITGAVVEKVLNPLDLSDQYLGWLVDNVQYASLQSGVQTTELPVVTFPCYNWIGSGESISFTANTGKHLCIENMNYNLLIP